ncbi:hypothetical protein N0V85_008551 [Neurospora sp. IMI 360204]|nr:hypothetical protein N0V85_008551 [Neurospora sp. IMI 360204]
MRFSLISAIATLGSVGMAQPVAQLTARTVTSQETIDALIVLRDKAIDLRNNHVEPMSPSDAFTEYPLITAAYSDIIVTTNGFVTKDESSGPGKAFSDEECTAVAGAYFKFFGANLDTLNDLQRDAAYHQSRPFWPEMWTTLEALRAAYDGLAFDVIAYCPEGKPNEDIKTYQSSLDDTIAQTDNAYHGLW